MSCRSRIERYPGVRPRREPITATRRARRCDKNPAASAASGDLHAQLGGHAFSGGVDRLDAVDVARARHHGGIVVGNRVERQLDDDRGNPASPSALFSMTKLSSLSETSFHVRWTPPSTMLPASSVGPRAARPPWWSASGSRPWSPPSSRRCCAAVRTRVRRGVGALGSAPQAARRTVKIKAIGLLGRCRMGWSFTGR